MTNKVISWPWEEGNYTTNNKVPVVWRAVSEYSLPFLASGGHYPFSDHNLLPMIKDNAVTARKRALGS